jgi:hypothetical protein
MMTPDRVSAWATGVGIGALAFMISWLVLNRLFGMWLPIPAAPVAALISAVVIGVSTAWQRGNALSHRAQQPIVE